MNFQNNFSWHNKAGYGLSIGFVLAVFMGPAVAEVVLPHPELGSIVFSSPEVQQTAIQPAEPVFVHPPTSKSEVLISTQPAPNYWWGAPPTYYGRNDEVNNASPYPSNRDVVTYNTQQAHNFSQDLYRHNRDSSYWYYHGAFGLTYPANYPPYYFYPGYPVPYYPPPRPNNNEFNQSSQPSNRDITTYHLNRAHQFSADRYKAP